MGEMLADYYLLCEGNATEDWKWSHICVVGSTITKYSFKLILILCNVPTFDGSSIPTQL
jgi:hypothetical protein